MAGVETNPRPCTAPDPFQEDGQLLKRVSQRGPLARRGFQKEAAGVLRKCLENAFYRRGNALEAFFFTCVLKRLTTANDPSRE